MKFGNCALYSKEAEAGIKRDARYCAKKHRFDYKLIKFSRKKGAGGDTDLLCWEYDDTKNQP